MTTADADALHGAPTLAARPPTRSRVATSSSSTSATSSPSPSSSSCSTRPTGGSCAPSSTRSRRPSGRPPADRRGGSRASREQQWVLIDYGDVVVHVFLDEIRRFYEIERLYRDAPTVDWPPDGPSCRQGCAVDRRRVAPVWTASARYRRRRFGAVAQLVERFHGMEEVRGSIPLSSTTGSPDRRTFLDDPGGSGGAGRNPNRNPSARWDVVRPSNDGGATPCPPPTTSTTRSSMS